MLTGALYFNKIPFIKTGIVFCSAMFVIYGLNWLIASVLFNNLNEAGPFHHVIILVGKEKGTLILPAKLENYFFYAQAFGIPAIMWLLPLIRLREKEF